MRALDRFLVTIKEDQRVRHQVWDARRPLAVGFPLRHLIERTESGFRVRSLEGALGEIVDAGIQEVKENEKAGGSAKPIRLSKGMEIQICPVRNLSAIYEIGHETGHKTRKDGAEENSTGWRIHACVGHWVLRSDSLEGAPYRAEVGGTTLFEVRRQDASKYAVEPRIAGLSLDGRPLSNEKPVTLEGSDLASAVIEYHGRQWRFGPNAAVAIQKDSSMRSISTVADLLEDEREWFKKALPIAGGFFLIFSLLVLLWPAPTPEIEEELIPEQYASIVMQKIEKSDAQEAAAGDGGPAVAKAEDTAVAQAFRSQALQGAVSNLLKGGLTTLLAQSDVVSGPGPVDAFKGSKLRQETGAKVVEGPVTGRKADVAALGGTGKGVGYGKGKRAGVSGMGDSEVSIDPFGANISDGLTQDEIGKVIHDHMSEIRYCYESALIRNPGVAGTLKAAFTIGPDGTVVVATATESTLAEPRLDDCVLRRLKTWKFPKPKGGVRVSVSYPFIFKTLGR